MAALLIGRRHRLRLIGAQTGGMHLTRAGRAKGTALLLTGRAGRIAATTAGLTWTSHERLARADRTAIKRLARGRRRTVRRTRTGLRGSSGARHRTGLRLLLLFQALNKIWTRWNDGSSLGLTR
jgi:hypothetical protein